jgi:hypothetical protein
MMNPVTFMASSNQDTMYFHQPSNESTWPKAIHASHHQRSQQSHQKQELGANAKRQGPKGHNNLAFCFVNKTQEGHQDTTSVQMAANKCMVRSTLKHLHQ